MTATQLTYLILAVAIARVIFYLKPQIWRNNLKTRRVLVEYMDSIVVAGVAALFIIHFLFRTFYIPSGSMIPTLKVNDYILVNEFVYRFKKPQRNDIIVFTPPPAAQAEGKEFIKRVIALGGEKVEIKDHKVFINDVPREDPTVENQVDYDMPAITVPPGHLFVMGDNRPLSADSHIWGFLPEKNVIGKAELIILPPYRIRVLK
ncbi:MAG: signal peptidase I [Firmicutes bacterium]|nr:signal peptidase I [Bacillota bacterium]